MKRMLAVLLLVLLILPVPVMADGDEGEGDGGEEGGSGGSSGGGGISIGALAGMITGPIVGAIMKVPEQAANKTSEKFESRADEIAREDMFKSTEWLTFKLVEQLKSAPDVEKLRDAWKKTSMVIMFLLAGLLGMTGLRLMLTGGSAAKTADAKEAAKDILVIFIIVTVSYVLYKTALAFSYGIASFIYPDDLIMQTWSSAGLPTLSLRVSASFLFFIVTGLAWLTVAFIKLMSVVGVVLFPIGVFLYFSGWNPTKQLGSSILMFLILMMFIPLLNMVILIASYGIGFGMALVGLLLIVIINYQAVKKVFSLLVAPAVAAGKTAVSAAKGGLAGGS